MSSEFYKFEFDLQPDSLTVQVTGEHQPYRKVRVKGLTASQVVRLIGLLLVFASQKNSP